MSERMQTYAFEPDGAHQFDDTRADTIWGVVGAVRLAENRLCCKRAERIW